MKFSSFILSMLCLTFASGLTGQTVAVSVAASDDAPIISRHIYGHFAEHLGRCIYDGFYVGEGSSIPNQDGVRLDVVEALKELSIPNLRWPGGCFADTYHWQDGIGPKADRPSMLNIWWGNVREDNSFGTHEFLNMCELLGTEPYLSANVGSGTPQEVADWVKYTTHPADSGPLPELRAKNGRTEPWNVKFWGLGNEAWGCGGNMRPEYYADIYRRYATFMTNWNNGDGLFRIASGASSNDYNWTEVLMKNIPASMIEAIALHHYAVIDWSAKGSAKDFTEAQYFTTMQRALEMEELITKHVAIMDRYDPKKQVDLLVDEWGGWYDVEPGTNGAFLYQQNTMRDALLAGTTLNTFNRHADRVKMANIAQAVNVLQAVILTEGEKMILTPTYHVFRMFKVHHDAKLIPVSFNSPEYSLEDQKLPAVSISASKNAEGMVHFSLTNIDSRKAHQVEIDVAALGLSKVSGEVLTGSKLQDHNTFDEPNKVQPQAFKGTTLKGGKMTLTLPPFSVVVLEAN
ncbi:alpha-N-arabinofuranosidase [Neolewinella lacunae]|uniref:non-reducing end alpha-L-arabinofuranosidase n=1 Tax=Neolewinella lacunae TaxID=1517758 RepID=A0A923PNN5_9BACT|nr:alpha-N-arabinofuranosidase [Neolewinella lacunae]MBC6995011.1 alpha-N-arabinofuranosidase [Neolewinella lacunae]MDN3633218.1 alpha-N-arabinofuranosidase [Neolewinella lacunae]